MVDGKVSEPGVRVMEGAVPLPVRLNEAVDPTALLPMLTLPNSVPEADGVNVTLIVQLPLTATVAGQLLVCANDVPALLVTLMVEIVSAMFPVLVSTTDCTGAALPIAVAGNVNEVGETEAYEPTPVAVSGTLCGEPVTLSVKISEPV